MFPLNHSFPFGNERNVSIMCNRSRSRHWISCVPVCWRSWTIPVMKGRQTASVCFSGHFRFLNSHRCVCLSFWFYLSFSQHCGRINSISTLLTPTHWSELLHSVKAFPNVGPRVQRLKDIQDQGPWWVALQLYNRQPSEMGRSSKQVLSVHSSQGSKVRARKSFFDMGLFPWVRETHRCSVRTSHISVMCI